MSRWVAIACSALGVACTSPPKQLPPRSPPPATPPAIAMPVAAPQPGHGRVVLDGTDGSMRISVRADTTFVAPGGQVPATRSGELCSGTPCVVDLPVGRYRLFLSSADGRFAHGDTDDLVIREGTTYYVRAPGKYEPPTWLPAFPVLIVAAATVLVSSGAILAGTNESEPTPGLVLIGAGVGVGIWGCYELYDASRAKQQEGATTTWHQ